MEFDDEVARLERALELGGDNFDSFSVERARADVAKARERRDAGVGITLAVLAGGTGSGKSTLFNALTGLQFADAGEIRPTTMDVTACSWTDAAGPLLDQLGVQPRRRISGLSELTTPEHSAANLVLLDLPDHDSVAASNAGIVNRVLPLADLIVWVLDPQKYADNLIHASYLTAMRERAERMIVVMNQIDTVPEGHTDELLTDVRRLLAADGMTDIPVYPVSALKKQGLEPVWDHIREAAEATGAAEITAVDELRRTRHHLGADYATGPLMLGEQDVAQLTDTFYEASGIPAIVEAVANPGVRGRALPKPEQPALAVVQAAREAWLDHAAKGLPAAWDDDLDQTVSSADALRRRVGTTLREVTVPKVTNRLWIWIVLAVLAACGGAVATSMMHSWVWAAVGALVALILIGVGVAAHRTGAQSAARNYDEAVRRALRDTVQQEFADPANAVLKRYGQVREALVDE